MRMRRPHQQHLFNSRLWRSSAVVLAAITVLAWPAWGADAAPASPVAAPAANPAAPRPAAGPEAAARDALAAFLQKMEPKHWDAISAMNFDRDQANERIKVFEAGNNFQDLADTYLYYLTKLPPDPQDYLDVLAGLNKVLAEPSMDDNGLLTLTFELADQFPAAADAVQQIRMRQAKYFLGLGGPEAALAVLHRLMNQPETAPAVRAEAAGTAGYLHENMGQTDEAIAAYRIAGQDLTTGASASEALLRASLLLLELGRTDDALAVINQLRAAPAEILNQYATNAPAIQDMLNLTADPQMARAYWDHQQAWLAQWNMLAAKLGVVKSSPALLAPYIESYPQLEAQASIALSQKNAAIYFQATDQWFQSGRFRPADLIEAARKLYEGIPLAPDHADDILALGEVLESNLPAGEKDVLESLAQLRAAALVNDDKPDVARDLVQSLLDKYGSEGTTGQALARLFGFTVLRSNSTAKFGAAAAALLAQTLADPAAHGTQRLWAVAVLNDLYTSLGRDADARALLIKELAQPADPGDPNLAIRQALQTTLDNLNQRALQGKGLEVGLDGWWQQAALPWYNYATAPAQADLLSKVDDPVVEVTQDFNRALDHTASLSVRVVALEMALEGYPDMFASGPALADGTNAFTARAEMPSDLRYLAWSQTTLHLLVTGQRATAEKMFASTPSGSTTEADDRADFDLWDDYLAQPLTVDAQQAFALKVLALPAIRHPSVLLLARIINVLASLNAVDTAQGDFNQLGGPSSPAKPRRTIRI